MKRFYPAYNLRTESPGAVVTGLTFRLERGGIQWTAVTAGLPTTVVIAVAWAFRSGLPPVVWVECARPKASKELLGAQVCQGPSGQKVIEETVAHATTTAKVLLLGGSTLNLEVVFHHIEVDKDGEFGVEQPHSRGWDVKEVTP